MLLLITGIIASYLIGAIPTAYIFGRLLKGIDIRKFGSGNVGATNALRVLGKKAGITVLFIDILKGFAAVFFFGGFFSSKVNFLSPEIISIIFGLSCVSGHNWTIFLGFKGGKGIASILGVLIALSVKIAGLNVILGLSILVWLAVFVIVRIVSAASIASALALPALMILFKQSNTLILLSFILSAFVIIRHKSNIKRILEGKEHRITFKKSPKIGGY